MLLKLCLSLFILQLWKNNEGARDFGINWRDSWYLKILKFIVHFSILYLLFVASPIEDRWNVVPDGEGRMHVVDVHQKSDGIESLFNPEVDTRYMLHTRSNPTSGQQITWTSQSIQNSNFNSAHPVRVLIHGWNSGLSSGMNIAPTASYLQLGDFNVIQVLGINFLALQGYLFLPFRLIGVLVQIP